MHRTLGFIRDIPDPLLFFGAMECFFRVLRRADAIAIV